MLSIPVFLSVPTSLNAGLQVLLRSPLSWLLLVLGSFILLGNLWQTKAKLSTGRFGRAWERWLAGRLAHQQRQQRKPHKVVLKAGNVELPNAQQSVIVTGAPDSGKTYSVIDPLIRSAIAANFPVLLYDFKGGQLAAHAAWAATQGYEVEVFAPGQPYTSVCNPLDFLANETDTLMARQLAEVLLKNTQPNSRDNDFFSSAGRNLVEALMLLAKLTPYPDLLMAGQILDLPNLPARIRQAGEDGKIPAWTLKSFSQLLSSQGAEEQLSGIIATAQRTFATFTGRQLVASFCGETTIPLDLVGKQILFLQVDLEKRDAVCPLLATVLHLLITRNFAEPRTAPLITALDEVPTIYLPTLANWVNEFRSFGFVGIIGFQNFAQLQQLYGQHQSKTLFAACGTKVFFNPKDYQTAAEFSHYLGEQDIHYHTQSQNFGRSGGSSRGEHYQKAPLMTPDQFLRLGQGECVVINSGYRQGRESSIPLRLRVKISTQEQQIQQRSEQKWKLMQQRLIDRAIERAEQTQAPLDVDEACKLRWQFAQQWLPLPANDKNTVRQSGSPDAQTHSTKQAIEPVDPEMQGYELALRQGAF